MNDIIYNPQFTRSSRLYVSKQVMMFLILLLGMSFCVAQNRKAFVVGLSNYSKGTNNVTDWNNIHGENDAKLIAKTLTKQGFQVVQILDNEGTANSIRTKLSNFSKSLKVGDIVYIHFSCHGQPVEDIDGDEADGWDEALVPLDAKKSYSAGYDGKNHLTDDELNGYLKTIRQKVSNKGSVYVVIDACHAGSVYRGTDDEDSICIRGTHIGFSKTGKLFVPRINKIGRFKIQHEPDWADICVIEACRSYQTNCEIIQNGNYYGSLSWYLNSVLSSKPFISDFSWVESVKNLMDKDTRLVRQNIVIEASK